MRAHPWRPLENEHEPAAPTPQRQAFDSAADELLYGGAAGGGKTDLLLGLALSAHRRSILFRREGTQLRAIEDRLADILGGRQGFSGQVGIWRLPGGRLLEFGHCQHAGDEAKYQGRPHDLKAFDELTHFSERQYRYLNTWKRTTERGQRTRTVSATNPPTSGEGEWVRTYWGPWLDDQHPHPARPGELRWYAVIDGVDIERESGAPFHWKGERVTPQSRSFIPSSVSDNPYLNAGYRATLQSLPEPLRAQMLHGDWSAGVEDDPWQVIPTAWVRAAEERGRSRAGSVCGMTALGVDVSMGGEDETVLTPRHGNRIGEQIARPGREMRDGDAVAALVAAHLRDGAQVNIDCTGGWGGDAWKRLSEMGVPVLRLVMSEASDQRDVTGSLGYRNKRAELWWRAREWFNPANGHEPAIPSDPRLRGDLCSARWDVVKGQAGQGGAIRIEAKEKQMQRLGRSPDRGESLIYALDDSRPRQRRLEDRRGDRRRFESAEGNWPF